MLGPVILLIVGLAGGTFAKFIGAPIPYLLGSLFAVATVVIVNAGRVPVRLWFPMKVREAFVVVIGTMIGSTFSHEAVSTFHAVWVSGFAVVLFIVLVLAINYIVFRKIGKYDHVTSFYASMPGGLVDSVTLGEQAGGSAQILTVQHFVRIALIVTIVPLGYWIWTGEAVGSSAGMSLSKEGATHDLSEWIILGAAAFVGYFGGKALRLPAGFFIGPLLVAAFIHGMGWTEAQLPDWMLSIAQLVVGTGFGARFGGMKRSVLVRAVGLGLISSFLMLSVGCAIAWALMKLTGFPMDVLILCFAPGGISEMGLIALSLQVNPVFVTAHHLLRILVTVFIAGASVRFFGRTGHG